MGVHGAGGQVALPFGTLDAVLADPINAAVAAEMAALLADNMAPEKLQQTRELVRFVSGWSPQDGVSVLAASVCVYKICRQDGALVFFHQKTVASLPPKGCFCVYACLTSPQAEITNKYPTQI